MTRTAIKQWFIFITICIFVVIFYGGTIRNGFIHDDHGQVEQNIYIQSLMYLPKVFTGCIWEAAVGNCKQTYYYRPLQSLSYMITYQLSSHPWIFHFVNLLYFAIDIWLVYLLIELLTKDKSLAILTAGIFLIHPVNTEVVNWIATVPELLYTLFILLSTYLFIRYRQTGHSKFLWWLTACYALGILSKEPAVFAPFVFLILDLMYFNKMIKDFLRWKNVSPYVLSLCSFTIYFLLRLRALGGLGSDPSYHMNIPQRIYVFIDLFGSYIRKLIVPYPLNLFYTFHPTYGIFRTDFIAAILITLAFIGLFVFAMKKKWKIVGFSLVWYITFLAPSLVFINSIGENLFAERHVFASTIGFALLLSLLLVKIWQKSRLWKIGLVILLGATSISSFVIVYQRNIVWKNDETIYADTLKKSPDADLIRYNLAYLYDQSDKTNQAKNEYGIIIKRGVWVGIAKAYNNLGNIARKEGNYSLAKQDFEQSLTHDPLHVESYNNLGAMSLEQGDLLTALTYLCQANRINPNFQTTGNNINRIVDAIQGMDEKTFDLLYQTLLTNGIFHPINNNQAFTLQNIDCVTTQGCLLTFTNHLPLNVFPFSFLIAGQTDDNQIVRPRRIGTRQATGDIILDIDKMWGSKNLRFSFPTCDRTYYQAIVEVN
jgi:protein O-mannosyl-transferase